MFGDFKGVRVTHPAKEFPYSADSMIVGEFPVPEGVSCEKGKNDSPSRQRMAFVLVDFFVKNRSKNRNIACK